MSEECCVLVADDDEDVRLAIIDTLQELGYRVLAATTGEEALQQALSFQPDVIILDHRMPGLSGAEVCRRLRAHGRTPIIIFTTAAREGPTLASELGVQHFLAKPFDFEEFLSTLEQACI